MKKLMKLLFCVIFFIAMYWNLSELHERGRFPDKEMFAENLQVVTDSLPTKDAAKTYLQENFPTLQTISESVHSYVENLENLLYGE